MTKARVNADNASADIQGVTAGTGLSGGGTSGTVTLTVDDSVVATLTGTQALTNKDLTGTGNTFPSSLATLSGSETLTNKTLTAPVVNLATNAQTGTTYTFVLTDNGKVVTASNGSAQTYTIPPSGGVAYPSGAQITVVQIGSGQVTFQQGSGVTIRSTGATSTAPKLRVQYSAATLVYAGSDVWYVLGDIS